MEDDYSQGASAPSSSTKKFGKVHNVLPLYGNEGTMNLNPLILANIQSSSYFKVSLFKLKTYHEVVDEIYYQVKHLEPWERGSRKTSGQTGMCGGVRGVGAGGIVSSAFCLLYKLYTLRLTRKQVNGLMSHSDSPYIRALGFMYVRYTQPPGDLFDWYEDYLQDDEEIDVKAGGGQMMRIGQMLHQWLTKLDWFSTLFPRIPVPIQKAIERRVNEYCRTHNVNLAAGVQPAQSFAPVEPERSRFNEPAARARDDRNREFERGGHRSDRNERTETRRHRSRSKSRDRYKRSKSPRDRYRSSHRSDRRDDDHRNKIQKETKRRRSRSRSFDRDYYDRRNR